MADFEVIIHFSNGEKVTVDENSVISPIKLVNDNGEQFSTKGLPIFLENVFHVHDGFIPELTEVFSLNEFFAIDEIDSYNKKFYKSSAIVSLEQKDNR